MTQEQEKSLQRNKNICVYTSSREVVDGTTGEVLSKEQEEVTKTSTEPDFIKVYYKAIMAFDQVDDVPLNFILALAEHIGWTNDGEPCYFQNTRMTRDKIAKRLKIGDRMVSEYIKRCVKHCLLIPTQYKGGFEVNPFYVAKGRWSSIRKLRINYKYQNGRWERKVEIEEDETTEEN